MNPGTVQSLKIEILKFGDCARWEINLNMCFFEKRLYSRLYSRHQSIRFPSRLQSTQNRSFVSFESNLARKCAEEIRGLRTPDTGWRTVLASSSGGQTGVMIGVQVLTLGQSWRDTCLSHLGAVVMVATERHSVFCLLRQFIHVCRVARWCLGSFARFAARPVRSLSRSSSNLSRGVSWHGGHGDRSREAWEARNLGNIEKVGRFASRRMADYELREECHHHPA